MTLKSKLIALFPLLHIVATLALLWVAIVHANAPGIAALDLLGMLAVVYLLPPLAYRIHEILAPLQQGYCSLSKKDYSPWWGGHQIQLVFTACPALEALLRCVPGLYSSWLRLWGSKIGKGVYWTPLVQILDRGLVEIGNGVVFGHESVLVCHVVTTHEGKPSLYVKGIKIGDGSFIGARAGFAPGVVVEPKTLVPFKTEGRIDQVLSRASKPLGAHVPKAPSSVDEESKIKS